MISTDAKTPQTVTRICVQIVVLVSVLPLAFGPQAASATSLLSCRPGVKMKQFASARYVIRPLEKRRLQQKLAAWGDERGYRVYGENGKDISHPARETWTSVLESPRGGIRIEIEFAEGKRIATARIKNQCWNRQESWAPHWKDLQVQMASWGVRRTR